MVKIIEGDLLKADTNVIVQQLNCLCVRPHGLSKVIATKFPYANVYARRRQLGTRNLAIEQDRSTPGTIVVSLADSSNITKPVVVGLYGQYDYGKPGISARRTTLKEDNYELREKWFKECLERLKIFLIETDEKSVAFPYQIGCGLAGGNWDNYLQMIKDFAKNAPFEVYIYKLPS